MFISCPVVKGRGINVGCVGGGGAPPGHVSVGLQMSVVGLKYKLLE